MVKQKEYRKMRIAHVTHLKNTIGANSVYPHKFHVSISLTEFHEKYAYLTNEQVSDDQVNVAGIFYRIFSILIEKNDENYHICTNSKRKNLFKTCYGPKIKIL